MKPEMAHPNLIEIREHKTGAKNSVLPRLLATVYLMPDVAARATHPSKYLINIYTFLSHGGMKLQQDSF